MLAARNDEPANAKAGKRPAPADARAHAAEPGSAARRSAAAAPPNPEWASLALWARPSPAVSRPGDPGELEAERIADQITRSPSVHITQSPSAPGQRSCAACASAAAPCPSCEEEEPVQRRAVDGASAPSASASSAGVAASLGPGRTLDAPTRQWFEPRIGVDLSAVRIHTDAAAGRAASGFSAHAFTVGSHIAFADGQYSPDTSTGHRLLAHELVHTVQQRATGPRIQRAADYDISGVQVDAASFPNIIFFDRASFNIPATEQTKIAPLAAPASRKLTLTGFTSEEGSAAGNLATINSRIARVSAALGTAGHAAARTANPQPTAGAGQIEYRRMRAVEVVPTPAAGPPPTSQPRCLATVANPHPEVEPCGASFSAAHPVAAAMVTKALTEVGGPTAAATAVAASLFPGVAMSTFKTGLTSLQAQLVVMAGRFQCHNTCDAGCRRPGYNSGSGATAMMTVCPDFIGGGSVDENATMLVHEGLHATPGVVAQDIAYRSSRMIQHISGAQATTNTDSWVSLVLRLNPGVGAAGPPTDTGAGMTPAENAQAVEALSFAESWMLTAEFDTSLLYEGIKRNVGRAGGWNPADDWTAGLQHAIGWIFGLTDPGPVPPYATPPTGDDQIKVAGIYDRYHRMRVAVWQRPIAIGQAPAPDVWAPNLGSSVTITAPFFAMSQMNRVLHLVRLMAASMPDVPAARRANYADAANQIRWHRGGVGP